MLFRRLCQGIISRLRSASLTLTNWMTRSRVSTNTHSRKKNSGGYVPYRGPVGDPLAFCRSLFPPAPVRSRADSFNLSALFWLILGLSIVPSWIYAVDRDVARRQARSPFGRSEARVAVSSPLAPTAFSFAVPMTATPTPMLTLVAPTLTPTLVPTLMPMSATPTPTPIILGYSYYWPPLGGVNCRVLENGDCSPYMASGQLWRDWVGRAVAVGYEMLGEMPVGSCWVRNVDGKRFIVQDICPACGSDYVDFLSPKQEFPWRAPIGFYPCTGEDLR